jgi:hypothetical protein
MAVERQVWRVDLEVTNVVSVWVETDSRQDAIDRATLDAIKHAPPAEDDQLPTHMQLTGRQSKPVIAERDDATNRIPTYRN